MAKFQSPAWVEPNHGYTSIVPPHRLSLLNKREHDSLDVQHAFLTEREREGGHFEGTLYPTLEDDFLDSELGFVTPPSF